MLLSILLLIGRRLVSPFLPVENGRHCIHGGAVYVTNYFYFISPFLCIVITLNLFWENTVLKRDNMVDYDGVPHQRHQHPIFPF